MPFGQLITELGVDLGKLEKDLAKARTLFAKFHADVSKQAVSVSTGTAVSSGRNIASKSAGSSEFQLSNAQKLEAAFIKIRQRNEHDERAFRALQSRGITENIKNETDAANNKQKLESTFLKIRRQNEADERKARAEQSRAITENTKLDLDGIKKADSERKKAAKEQNERDRNFRSVETDRRQAIAEEIRAQEVRDRKFRQTENARRSAMHEEANRATVGGRVIDINEPSKALERYKKLQTAIAVSGTLTERLGKKFDDIGQKNLKNMVSQAQSFLHVLGAVAGAGIIGGIAAVGKLAIDINKRYEGWKITLAEVLSLTTDLVDANGKAVSAPKQIAENYKVAQDLIVLIRHEAIKTVLTTKELAENVAQTLGFTTAAGATPQQGVKLISRISNLAKSLGAIGEREQGFEVRALLTGQNITRSRIGRALGMSSEEIKGALETGKLIELLNNRLRAGEPFIAAYEKSFDGLTSTLIDKGQELVRQSTEKVFDKLKAKFSSFNESLGPNAEKITEWADTISDALVKGFESIDKFFKSEGFKNAMDFFKFLIAHSREIIATIAALKGLQLLSAGRAFLQNQNRPGALLANTALGAGLQSAGNLGLGNLISKGAPIFGGAAATATGGAIATGGAVVSAAVAIAIAALPLVLASGKITSLIHETITANRERAAREREDAAMLAKASPQVRLLREARDRRAEAEQRLREFNEKPVPTGLKLLELARGRPLSPNAATMQQRKELEADVTFTRAREAQVSRDVELPGRMKTALEEKKTTDAGLKRESLVRRQRDRERRESLEQERIDVAKRLAQMRDDKIAELRATAEADKREVQFGKSRIEDAKRRAEVLKEIELKLQRDIQSEREKERISVAKQLADMADNKRKQLAVELEETIFNIKEEHHSREVQAALIIAARKQYLNKLKDFNQEEKMGRLKFIADTTGNEIQQIRLAAVQEFNDRKQFIKEHASSEKQANREIVEARIRINAETDRKIFDTRKEWAQKAHDLAREIRTERETEIKNRIALEKDVFDFQKRSAKELRDLLRERKDAQRDLARAEKDLAQSKLRLTESDEKRRLREQAGLFVEMAVGSQIVDVGRRKGLDIDEAQAESRRQINELRDQLIQSGGAKTFTDFFRENKFRNVGPAEFGRASEFERRGTEAGLTAEKLSLAEEIESDKREAEDKKRSVEDANRKVKELAEQEQELRTAFNNTVKELQERFNAQVRESADKLAKLGEEAANLSQIMRRSNESFASNFFRTTIGQMAKINPTAARAQAEGALSPGSSFIFGPNSINITGNVTSNELLAMLIEAVEKANRRANPLRR